MHWIILDSYICVELYNIANSETNAGNLNDRAGKGSTELGYSWLFHVSGFLVILCLEEVRKLGWMYWSQTQHGSCSGDVEIVQVFHRIHPFISQNTTKQHITIRQNHVYKPYETHVITCKYLNSEPIPKNHDSIGPTNHSLFRN